MKIGSWVNSVRGRLEPLRSLAGRISWRVGLGAACLGLAGLWLHEHDARVRQSAALEQGRREAAAEVASLKKQAAAKVKAANVQNAQAIQKLAARRRELDRRDRQLAEQLASLRQKAQAQSRRVATLPTSEVVTRVAARLGLEAQDLAQKPVGAVSSPPVARATAAPASGEPFLRHGRLRPPLQNRAVKTPFLQTGEHSSPLQNRAVKTPLLQTGEHSSPLQKGARDKDTAPTGRGETSPQIAALPLSASGARKVAAALVDLDACRAESQVEEQQLANCRERAATDAATIERQADSLGKLNQALAAKDQILKRQEAACQAALRAARGTFWSRLGRTARQVLVGVAAGVVIGVAAR